MIEEGARVEGRQLVHVGSKRTGTLVADIIRYVVLGLLSFAFLVPLAWMISTSLKTDFEILLFPPTWIPQKIMWSNYKVVFEYVDAALYIKNSLIVAGIVIIGNILSCSMVAYAFARLRARASGILFAILLATMMIPGQVTMVPLYMIFKLIGWLDSFKPLTVPSFFGTAFYVFLLRQFFRSIPIDFSESGRIDGASELRILWQIIMPLAKPALITVGVFSFIGAWNDFLGPLLYINSRNKLTIALAISLANALPQMFGHSRYNYTMALSCVALLPTVLLFIFAQRYYVEGIILGGIKG